MTARVQPRIEAHAFARPVIDLFAPGGLDWEQAAETSVRLSPTPVDAQPSAYVRALAASRVYGTLEVVEVSAATSGDAFYVRLRWQAANPQRAITDNDVFADACAVMFPLAGGDAPLATMGSPEHPVQAWHWRAGTEVPFVVNATGLGTSTRLPHHAVTAAAEWARDRWSVVFRRPLDGAGVPLQPHVTLPVAFAVWQGCNAERAGLASRTPAWLDLDIAT